ncbi:MAG: phage major tail protein, TP901-1 family, partial [Pseudomonadota bacterium]
GVKTCAISGSGVFKDATTDARVREIFFDGLAPDFQIVVPDFGVIEGPFQVTTIEYSGSHDGEAAFEMAFASAGLLEFTAL